MAIYSEKQTDGTWISRRLISRPLNPTMLAYAEQTTLLKGHFHDENIEPLEIWEDCDE